MIKKMNKTMNKTMNKKLITIVSTCLIFLLLSQVWAANPSMYFYLCNEPGFDSSADIYGSAPVIVGDWLYLYTWTEENKYSLWQIKRGNLPSEENFSSFDRKEAWEEKIDLSTLGDPNKLIITAMCEYKDDLYLGLKIDNQPSLRRLDDPNDNEGSWAKVGPTGLSSGTIRALYSFNDHLYNDHLYMETSPLSTGEAAGFSLWSSKEAEGDKPDSQDWETLQLKTMTDRGNKAILSFQPLGSTLFLGTENLSRGGEVWQLKEGEKSPSRASTDSLIDKNNLSIPCLAEIENQLFAVTQNSSKGAQIWSYTQKQGFLEVEADSWEADVKRHTPISLQGLGSYLFLGFDSEFDSEEEPLRMLNLWDTKLKSIPLVPRQVKDDQPFLDANNQLCGLAKDQDNGFLYLCTQSTTQSTTQGFKLWKSTQLAMITITSPAERPWATNQDTSISWKTTKGGDYVVCLTDFTDPNHTLPYSSRSLNKIIIESSPTPQSTVGTAILVSFLSEGEGTYRGEIFWDTNQAPSAKDQYNYPVQFAFVYDCTPPPKPILQSVSPGNESLTLQWTQAKDKLSGIAYYYLYYQAIAEEEDPNAVTFSVGERKKISLSEAEDGEDEINDLTNYQRYAVAVSAVDAAGNESELSDLEVGTPEPGQGLMDLVGEKGNCFIHWLWPIEKSIIQGRQP